MERKQSLTAVMQIDSGGSAPPPRTSSSSNGGRNPLERGGAPVQRSDVSEGERKREEWGSVAVVCASSGSGRRGFL
jgi:hypothetical protein